MNLPRPVKCCRCGRVITGVHPATPEMAPPYANPSAKIVVVCSCDAVLAICGVSPETLHTHEVMIRTPQGERPMRKEEALALSVPDNAPMN